MLARDMCLLFKLLVTMQTVQKEILDSRDMQLDDAERHQVCVRS